MPRINRTSDTTVPALLVSYYYLDNFLKQQHHYDYRYWTLDSGAFSAYNYGIEIPLQSYIDACKKLLDTDTTLKEIYALDVIGDWKASKANTEEMWRQGIEAIPCFHRGEPWDLLKEYCKEYPKVALGHARGNRKEVERFVGQCFAHCWPHRFHGFGCSYEYNVLKYPLETVDSVNWDTDPNAWGRWRAFKGARIPVRGSYKNLRCEVEYYLTLEERARGMWKNEMKLLGVAQHYPHIYLGMETTAHQRVKAKADAFRART